MSSSSASVCENYDYCQYYALDNNYNNYDNYSYGYDFHGNPFQNTQDGPIYSTMGQPLVYYAQMQRPLNRKRQCEPRKPNQNCFVKAFKWYTQERECKRCDVYPDRSGFANWLDVKYVEYLRNGQVNQTVYELSAKETTTIEPCGPCPSSHEPCTSKKFARMRNPWRKRTRPCKDSGDVPEKSTNQSCEFIMQPKDLTRANSDLCYSTPMSGFKQSNATVSSGAPTPRAPIGRSFSMASISCVRSAQKPVDIIPCGIEGTPKPQAKKPTSCCEQIQQVPSKSRGVDVACQCPEEKMLPVDVQTQCENSTCKCLSVGIPSPVPSKTRIKNPSKYDLNPTPMPSMHSYSPQKQVRRRRSNVVCQCPKETESDCECCKCPCITKWKPPSITCQNDSSNKDIQDTNKVLPKTVADACDCKVKDVPMDPKQVVPKPIKRPPLPTVTDTECECLEKEDVQDTKPVVIVHKAIKRPRISTVTYAVCECIVKDSAGVPEPIEEMVSKIKSIPSCDCSVRNISTHGPLLNQPIEPKTIRRPSCPPVSKEEICTCMPEGDAKKKSSHCLSSARVTTDDLAQTSDHSICLEMDKYPIIMRVIC